MDSGAVPERGPTCEHNPGKLRCVTCRAPHREKQRAYIQAAFKRLNPQLFSNVISK